MSINSNSSANTGSSVGIILLNYFSSIETISTYDKLKGTEYANNIVIVDNSCDQSEQKALTENAPDAQIIINNSNTGYAAGNNLGIKKLLEQSQIEFFVIINPDVCFDPHILEILIVNFDRKDKLAAVGPRMLRKEEPTRIYSDGGTLITDKRIIFSSHLNSNLIASENNFRDGQKPDYVHGAFIIFSRRALENVGLLPEEYFLYFEETDWCQTAITQGWEIFTDIAVFAFQAQTKRGQSYHFYMTRNRYLFNSKFNDNFNWPLLMLIDLRKSLGYLRRIKLIIGWAIFSGMINGVTSYVFKKDRYPDNT